MKNTESIPAGEFKAKCLRLMDQVNGTGRPIIITKRGEPVAQLIPFEAQNRQAFGCLKGTVTIISDITGPIDEAWNANR